MVQYHYIAGQTPINEDEKKDLIPSLITQEDLNKFEQENIIEARHWLMNRCNLQKLDIFNEDFILNLHHRMFRHVWKWAGKYRKSNKNIGIDFYLIPVELKILIEDAKFWLENDTYSVSDIAIIFHHRLVKIHLFSNGNGRHARLYADAVIKKYKETPLSWGKGELDAANDFRKKYIFALREADGGDYNLLLQFAR